MNTANFQNPKSEDPQYEILDNTGWHSFKTFDEQHKYKLENYKSVYYSKSYFERLFMWVADVSFIFILYFYSLFSSQTQTYKIDPRQSNFYSLYTPGWLPGTVNWQY